MLLPIFEISATMLREAPRPIASTTITAAMPKMMPSIVRALRVLLRQIARTATRKIMNTFTPAAPPADIPTGRAVAPRQPSSLIRCPSRITR